MLIKTHAYARAGLIGNPSDGYFGKTISIIVRNFSATVTCYESPRIQIVPWKRDQLEFSSLGHLLEDVQLNGYYGGIRLIKATIKRFCEYCRDNGIDVGDRQFTLEYDTNIPVRVGLAGSSGIITATMRALCEFYGVNIPLAIMPNVILSVEVDELNIGAGLQDRVIQTYEGVVYMDFDKGFMEKAGHGRYEQLAADSLPPLFVAYHDSLAEGTEVTHNDLRSRYNRGDAQVHAAMGEFAGFAEETKALLEAGRGSEIGPLLDANFDLRAKLCAISEGNHRLVQIGRELGAAVKFAGSGGAVIGCYDGDPARLERLGEAYRAFGAELVTPMVAEKGV